MDLLRDVDAAAPGRASGRPAAAESLAALIRGRAAVVGVIGFGHVGESPIRHLDAARVRALLDTQKLAAALNERGRAVKGSRVLLLGISYKRDIGDLRESPAFEILRLPREAGAIVTYHDPHVPAPPPALESVPLTADTVSGSDAVILVTDHSAIDYEWPTRHAKLIVDTRGVYRRPADHIVKS